MPTEAATTETEAQASAGTVAAPQSDAAGATAQTADDLEPGESQELTAPLGVTADTVQQARDRKGQFVSAKEKAQDAAYKAMTSKAGPPERKPGKAAAETDADEATEAKPVRVSGKAAADPETLEADADGRAARRTLDRSTQALLRTGLYTTTELAAMPEAEILRRGARAIEQVARRDRDFTRSKRGTNGTTSHDGNPASRGTDQDGLPPDRRTAAGTRAGDPGHEPDPLDELDALTETEETASGKDRPSDGADAGIQRELRQERMENVRLTLQGTFPLLKEERFLRLVASEMNEMDPSMQSASSRDSLHSLMRRACLVVFGDQIAHEARDRSADASRAARAGQPMHGIRAASAKPAASGAVDAKDPDAVRNLAYESLGKGKTHAERRQFMRDRMKRG